MTAEEALQVLNENHEVGESYVLVRQLHLFLKFNQSDFSPRLRVKIFLTNALVQYPYSFDVSFHVHTPAQAAPYYPSNTVAETEPEAIRRAISTTTTFIKSAIDAGHIPSNNWLVNNEEF